MPTTAVIEAPPRGGGARIAMFVYNSCATDPRVLKEARTLTQAGHAVTVYAVLDRETVAVEERDGFRIIRIDRQPAHLRVRATYRLLRSKIRPFRLARKLLRRTVRAAVRAFPAQRIASSRLCSVLARAWRRFVVAGPLGRAYRYARWKALLHVPLLRRRFYRRRAARLRSSDGAVEPVASAPSSAPGRVVGRWTWRAVMVFHKPLNFVDYYRRAYDVAMGEGFDVLHAHDLLTLPVGAALARKTKKPLVYDAHELYTEMSTLRRTERLVWKYLERRHIGRATRIVTVCESIAGEFVSRYRVDPPLVLLNCPPASAPPATRSNRLRERAGIDDPSLRLVLYQGGLVPNRGIEELIRASASFDDAVLVLMGWGRIEPMLREQVAREGLEQRVIFTGAVPQSELPSYTCGADVGVIPYKAVGLNNYYTTPNKLFEYLAAGLPIACSRFPELRRFVERTGAGLTFDPSDPDDIALAVNGILADEEIRRQMREAALATAAPLTWEREAEKLVALYAGLEVASAVA